MNEKMKTHIGTVGDVLEMKNIEKARKKVVWLGGEHCDFCQEDLHKVPWFVDGRTQIGPWAIMCPPCYKANGVGRLGTGYGQKYDGKTFEKIGG